MSTQDKHITLVATCHKEKGIANTDNLLSVLKKIEPDVIFIELPPERYDDYFNTRVIKSPEASACLAYQGNHIVDIVPVDAEEQDRDLLMNILSLTRELDNHSAQLVSMDNMLTQYIFQYGYPYMISPKHSQHLAEIKNEEISTLNKLNDPWLNDIFAKREALMEQREKEMLDNIRDYAEYNTYMHAVFLVGSAHTYSMLEKSKDCGGLPEMALIDYSNVM